MIYLGCAGWSLRKEFAEWFPAQGSHLQRYAQRFNAVEINSSFYRPHRRSTYERWADSTPNRFRFSVKLPRQITHFQKLASADELLDEFIDQTGGLGEKLGVVLVQLPPSHSFQASIAIPFFDSLRERTDTAIALEPRHPTWFTPEVEAALEQLDICRVAADPSIMPAAAEPGGSLRSQYFRWHGSPKMYHSSYDESRLHDLANRLKAAGDRQLDGRWCIFDNTAEGEATRNALRLRELLDT